MTAVRRYTYPLTIHKSCDASRSLQAGPRPGLSVAKVSGLGVYSSCDVSRGLMTRPRPGQSVANASGSGVYSSSRGE